MANSDLYDLRTGNHDDYALNIQRMETIFRQADGQTDVAHRHSYYTVIWVLEGAGVHTIDFNSYPLEKNAVFFVSPGQVHQVDTHSPPSGWVITFSKSFLQHNHITEDFITEINLFNSFYERPAIILPPEVSSQLETLMQLMEETFQSAMNHKIAALSAYLKLFLIHCSNQCTYRQSDLESAHGGKHILKNFKELVTRHYRQWHKVGDYAAEMSISPKYLNQVVKALLGQTAKEVIQEKIILNAKRELKYSDKSIKEIAYELGFNEPLYFSSFFKKCTGVSPSAFKEQQSLNLS